jgi:WD40 repeat protein
MWAIRFSYEYSDSNRILYYLYNSHDAGTPLNKVDLGDLSDEKIIENCHSSHLAPGPGDTLFAFDKTIFNLNTGEETALEVYGGSFDWNPANPRELLVAGGIKKVVYICDLDSNKIRKFSVNNEDWIFNARYSPDGKRIAVESQLYISEGGEDWGSIWIFDPE